MNPPIIKVILIQEDFIMAKDQHGWYSPEEKMHYIEELPEYLERKLNLK